MNIERIIIDAEEGGIGYVLAMLKLYIADQNSSDLDLFYYEFEQYFFKAKKEMEQSRESH